MSYADYANLANDGQFQARRDVACTLQAKQFTASTMPHYVALANAVIESGPPGALIRAVNTQPGFDESYAEGGQEAITDGDLNSAVFAVWPQISTLLYPDLVPPADQLAELQKQEDARIEALHAKAPK